MKVAKRFCIIFVATSMAFAHHGWANEKADKPDKPAVELAKVEFKRQDKGKFIAVVTLKEPLPKSLDKADIRFLFLKADSGLSPKSATDINATGTTQLKVSFLWSCAGGLLSKSGKEVGFVLDLSPNNLKEWPSSAPKVIEVPLDSSTLLEGMGDRLEQGKGQLYVAFVKYGKDGNSRISISNTVSAKIE